MKKNYIAPESSVYAVRTTAAFLDLSLQGDANKDSESLIKEEKSEAGSGIWDLYN